MTEQNRTTPQPEPVNSEQPADRGEELTEQDLDEVAGGKVSMQDFHFVQ
jgi:hypothetical protein